MFHVLCLNVSGVAALNSRYSLNIPVESLGLYDHIKFLTWYRTKISIAIEQT